MKNYKGFTLIELMISVLIVGILAAIAYPAYMKTVQKGNRAEAKAELTDVVQRLQRCYTNLGKFNDDTNCNVFKQLNTGTKKIISRDRGFYEITLDGTPTETTYKLKAKAVLAPQTNDVAACKEMFIDQTGTKTPADCWK